MGLSLQQPCGSASEDAIVDHSAPDGCTVQGAKWCSMCKQQSRALLKTVQGLTDKVVRLEGRLVGPQQPPAPPTPHPPGRLGWQRDPQPRPRTEAPLRPVRASGRDEARATTSHGTVSGARATSRAILHKGCWHGTNSCLFCAPLGPVWGSVAFLATSVRHCRPELGGPRCGWGRPHGADHCMCQAPRCGDAGAYSWCMAQG